MSVAYLDDENLDEERRVSRVRDRGGRAGDADAETAEQVAETDREAAPEDGEGCCQLALGITQLWR